MWLTKDTADGLAELHEEKPRWNTEFNTWESYPMPWLVLEDDALYLILKDAIESPDFTEHEPIEIDISYKTKVPLKKKVEVVKELSDRDIFKGNLINDLFLKKML